MLRFGSPTEAHKIARLNVDQFDPIRNGFQCTDEYTLTWHAGISFPVCILNAKGLAGTNSHTCAIKTNAWRTTLMMEWRAEQRPRLFDDLFAGRHMVRFRLSGGPCPVRPGSRES